MCSTLSRPTYPLWQCISIESLVKLAIFQWKEYGLKLELIKFTKIESSKELQRIMKQKPCSSPESRK